jgi:lipopolysaccharide/colanic/teichoic acid biosynthesis glycosyltransferase
MEAERVAPLDYWPDAEESDEGWQSGAAPPVLSAVRPVELAHPAAETALESGRYAGFGKRTFDLVAGIPLFLASVPVIVVAAVAIGVTSGWPVFYKTRRLGANGREFTMWKLRSMVKNADQVLADWRISNPQLAAEYEASFKLKQDPRITAVGRFIRRTSIDELPQFWNVLRGDMSLVGPRPYYARELEPHPLAYKSIIKVRPGVTGAWQVAGRNSLSPAERMFIDRTYVNTCCFRTDFDLLLKTIRTLLRPNGY